MATVEVAGSSSRVPRWPRWSVGGPLPLGATSRPEPPAAPRGGEGAELGALPKGLLPMLLRMLLPMLRCGACHRHAVEHSGCNPMRLAGCNPMCPASSHVHTACGRMHLVRRGACRRGARPAQRRRGSGESRSQRLQACWRRLTRRKSGDVGDFGQAPEHCRGLGVHTARALLSAPEGSPEQAGGPLERRLAAGVAARAGSTLAEPSCR